MQYAGKLYGEGGIPLMLTAQDVDALESMRSRLCAALGLPADSAPETVAEAVETHRVVVPELTEFMREFMIEDGELPPICGVLHQWLRCRALQAIREHSRAIPADRVLGDGMVAVRREELIALETLEKLYRGTARPSREMNSMLRRLDAIRDNSGGLNHVHV